MTKILGDFYCIIKQMKYLKTITDEDIFEKPEFEES